VAGKSPIGLISKQSLNPGSTKKYLVSKGSIRQEINSKFLLEEEAIKSRNVVENLVSF
jgi:hypothetical protein